MQSYIVIFENKVRFFKVDSLSQDNLKKIIYETFDMNEEEDDWSEISLSRFSKKSEGEFMLRFSYREKRFMITFKKVDDGKFLKDGRYHSIIKPKIKVK